MISYLTARVFLKFKGTPSREEHKICLGSTQQLNRRCLNQLISSKSCHHKTALHPRFYAVWELYCTVQCGPVQYNGLLVLTCHNSVLDQPTVSILSVRSAQHKAASYSMSTVLSRGRNKVLQGHKDKIGFRSRFQSWLDGQIMMAILYPCSCSCKCPCPCLCPFEHFHIHVHLHFHDHVNAF